MPQTSAKTYREADAYMRKPPQSEYERFARYLTASGATDISAPKFYHYMEERQYSWAAPRLKYFLVPTFKSMGINESENHITYLAGNSLGLMPRSTPRAIIEELDAWADRAVYSHFDHPKDNHWAEIDHVVTEDLAQIVGARREEVGVMGSLTANMHLLMCSFYRPTKERYKILYEELAFPSDRYAFESQVRMHGYDPSDALLTTKLRPNEYTYRTEDILHVIEEQGDSIALVFFSGVNYYNGQCFDMEAIARAAKRKGCMVGFDLAHAAGNVVLHLHDWQVDFAVWCSYKYLNSGPGGIAGFFVHENNFDRPRLSGWWGHDMSTRFDMTHPYSPARGASGFQLSNPSVVDIMSLYSSIQLFNQNPRKGKDRDNQDQDREQHGSESRILKEGHMYGFRRKSVDLTSYLYILLTTIPQFLKPAQFPASKDSKPRFTIITPEDPDHRGCQLSLLFNSEELMAFVNKSLYDCGVIGDERKPAVIRLSPVPMYNTFEDCTKAVKAVGDALLAWEKQQNPFWERVDTAQVQSQKDERDKED